MTTKNNPIEITTAIVGGIFTAIHIIVAIYLMLGLSNPSFWSLQSTGFAALFEIPIKFIIVVLVLAAVAVAMILLILEILPLCFKSAKAGRVIAIVSSSLLGIIIFYEVIIFMENAVSSLRGGNYLSAMPTMTFFALATSWFALNITKALIYKEKK